MRRTLPLLAVIATCGAGLAYGLPAATGSPTTGEAEARAALAAPERVLERPTPVPSPRPIPTAVQPATGSAAPSSPAVPAPAVSAPAPAETPAGAPAPVAVTPRPVPVAPPAPAPVEGDSDGDGVTDQRPEEVIGSYRCPDPIAVVIAIAADGSFVCEVQP